MREVNLLPVRFSRRFDFDAFFGFSRVLIVIIFGLFLVLNWVLNSLSDKVRDDIDRLKQPAVTDTAFMEESPIDEQEFFFKILKKISLSANHHIQLNDVQYEDRKAQLSGESGSIDDLSAWVKEMNQGDCHAILQKLGKSTRSNQFHFLVSIR